MMCMFAKGDGVFDLSSISLKGGHAVLHNYMNLKFTIMSARGPTDPFILVHVDNWSLEWRHGIVVHGFQRMVRGY